MSASLLLVIQQTESKMSIFVPASIKADTLCMSPFRDALINSSWRRRCLIACRFWALWTAADSWAESLIKFLKS